MEIKLKIPADLLTWLRESADPEHETWQNDSDLTQNDVADMVEDILHAWYMSH